MFLFSVSSWDTHLQIFSPFFQMPNVHRIVNVEFSGNFLCSCKEASFDDCSQLADVNFWWPVTGLLIFKSLVSFAKLEPLYIH